MAEDSPADASLQRSLRAACTVLYCNNTLHSPPGPPGDEPRQRAAVSNYSPSNPAQPVQRILATDPDGGPNKDRIAPPDTPRYYVHIAMSEKDQPYLQLALIEGHVKISGDGKA